MSTGKIVGLVNALGGSPSGGGGLPTGGEPFKQLVTDADGKTVWEDRLVHDIPAFSYEVTDVSSLPFIERVDYSGNTYSMYQVHQGGLAKNAFEKIQFFDLTSGSPVAVEPDESGGNGIGAPYYHALYIGDWEIDINLYDGELAVDKVAGNPDAGTVVPAAGIWVTYYGETTGPSDFPAFSMKYDGGNTLIDEKYMPETIIRVDDLIGSSLTVRDGDEYLYTNAMYREKVSLDYLLSTVNKIGRLPLLRKSLAKYAPVEMFEDIMGWAYLMYATESGYVKKYTSEYNQK